MTNLFTLRVSSSIFLRAWSEVSIDFSKDSPALIPPKTSVNWEDDVFRVKLLSKFLEIYRNPRKKISMHTQNDAIGKCVFISNVAIYIYFWGSICQGGIDHPPIFLKTRCTVWKKMLVHLVHFAWRKWWKFPKCEGNCHLFIHSILQVFLACCYIRTAVLRQVLIWKTTSFIPCHVGATYH